MPPYDLTSVNTVSERTQEPAWLATRRESALERFEALPWPDPSSEAWRYTKLDDFDLETFTPIGPRHERVGSIGRLPVQAQTAMDIAGERAGHVVHVDGDAVYGALDDAWRAKGVVFTTFAEASAEHEGLLRDWLGQAGPTASDEKFQALAAAFAGPGAFVYVPRGVEVTLPLQTFRYITQAGLAVFGRTLVVADEGSAVTLIEHLRSAHLDGPALNVGTAEIHALDGANVSVLTVQDWSPAVFHFATQRAVVHRDATVRSLVATLGARMSRSVAESVLDGQGSYSEMLGVYFGDSAQHFDHRSLQEHVAPHSKSDLYYKGALKGRSTAVYSGLIHIGKQAQKSDSWQGNRNLILSDHAKADSIPYLEIEANDVRCAHGASVGPPDEDVLFYLRSRGLDPEDAERLVVKGFFQEVLDRVRVGEVKAALEAAVEAELEEKD